MRNPCSSLWLLISTSLTAFSQTRRRRAPYNCEPVNPTHAGGARAAEDAVRVSGKGILSGQHNFPNQRSQDTDRVYAATGKYPAIWGSDFGFLDGEDKDSVIHRDLMIEEAKKQAAADRSSICVAHVAADETNRQSGRERQAKRSLAGSVQARLTDEQWRS